jgi:hypothetical protein
MSHRGDARQLARLSDFLGDPVHQGGHRKLLLASRSRALAVNHGLEFEFLLSRRPLPGTKRTGFICQQAGMSASPD